MNDSNSVLEPNGTRGNPSISDGNRQLEPMDPVEVEEYMRHAARMMYDIIQDWLKAQPAYKRRKKRAAAPERTLKREGRVS